MPKMKTKKAVAKRFKLTAKGKLKKNKANKRHLLEHKSSKRRRRLRSSNLVDKADAARIVAMLPYS